jgi:GT2 family glycosyltransferase
LEKENSKNCVEVSIIIVNYKSYNLIINCIDSLIRETKNVNYELIVVDNSSDENSASDLINRFKSLVFIKNNDNRGFGIANNQGLRIAKGRYVLFLNNDTLFFENTIKKVLDFAESLNSPLVVGCKLLNQDKSLQHSVFDFPTLMNVFASNFFLYALFPRFKLFNKYSLMNKKIDKITEVEVVTGAFLFCSRDFIAQIGGFDERFFFYNEEIDLCFRVKKNKGKVYYFPKTSLMHLKGGTAKTISWFSQKHMSISTIKLFQKYFKSHKLVFALVFHFTGIFIRIPIFLLIGLLTFNINLMRRSFFYVKLLFVYPKNLFKIK